MFGKYFFVFNFIVLTISCAQPKYVEEPKPLDQRDSYEKPGTCSIAFKSSGICLSYVWESQPNTSDYSQLVFKIFRLSQYDSTPIEIDSPSIPQVVLWMPSMGHGSTPTEVERLDVGTYRAKNIFFIMPGEWDIHFRFTNDVGTQDEATINLTL